MVQYFPVVTGSLTVNGDLSVSGNVAVTGSLSGTSSLAANSQLLSGTGSVGFTTTGSFTAASSSLSSRTTQIESVYATTGSNSFRANQSITGSLTVTGQIIAQTINVQQVTSSIVYSSGSNVFGCDINSRQTFTGSVYITGSSVFANVGTLCVSNCICANIVSAPTISAGDPTNSRIVANSNTIYGFYNTEANYRWALGRDVWAGGSVGLAFGVGNTTNCYAMIGDPSGYGCTIGFSILVPNGCSGTTYEKMRVTSGGNLLIGKTSSTGGKLQVSNGTDMFNVDHDANGPYISAVNNANTVYKRMTYDASEHVFNTSATSKVYITSAGNVGIATDAPSTKFEVCSGYIKNTGATNASGYLYYNTSANYTLALSGNASYAQLYSTDNIALMFGNNNTARMFIQTNGFVGVATTSPKAVFDVACGNAHSTISTWCKSANYGTAYSAFIINVDEASFAGTLYVQSEAGGIGAQAIFDILTSYDKICAISRASMNRGNGECILVTNYASGGGSKTICITQYNGAVAAMNMSAMLVGTAYGGSYICAQA